MRLTGGLPDNDVEQDQQYTTAVRHLVKQLEDYPSAQWETNSSRTIFLTGATGFLGAYILQDIMNQKGALPKVIAHVRAKSPLAGLKRIQETCEAYGIWSQSWRSRLECVIGDLKQPRLGLASEDWEKVANEAEIIVHNGAQVNWILPYDSLEASNVISTLHSLALCATGKPKYFTFVSSTSVLDTDHYVRMSESGASVPEDDDLEGSRRGLGTGYGQSKWVSEYLVREAGRKGLRGSIVRPGYVTGDSHTGGKPSISIIAAVAHWQTALYLSLDSNAAQLLTLMTFLFVC